MRTEDIDRAILAALTPRWQKVAMVIAVAAKSLHANLDHRLDEVAERLYALVDQGLVEATGNIENWRHSEVRTVSAS